MKFYTSYDPAPTRASNPGRRVVPEYKVVTDETTGNTHLEEIDSVNVYEQIQSWSNAADIQTRLAMFANGDKDALNASSGVYGDFSAMPHSYVEAHQNAINADNVYQSLPDDIKNLFGSFSQFKYDFVHGNVDKKLINHLTNKPVVSAPVKESEKSE